MRLNNKGYMLVEIILASVIAFGIAYFILELTVNLKNKNDDLFVETQVVTDQTIITNKLMEYAKKEKEEFDCDLINPDGKIISYGDKEIDILNDYANFTGEYSCENNTENSEININIPLNIPQLVDRNFDIKINYKYNPPFMYNVTYDWNVDYFTSNNGTSQGVTYSYDASTQTLTLNGTWTGGHHITFGVTSNLSFNNGNKYKLNMTYVSGSYTVSSGIEARMAVQPRKDSTDIQGHTLHVKFPQSGSVSGVFTSVADTTGANKFALWAYQRGGDSGTKFTNYKVRLSLTRVYELVNTYGKDYVFPPNPSRTGYLFDGWYTEKTSGFLVDEDTIMNRLEDHTLYAHYTQIDTTKPTCKLQANGITVSFKTKSDNVGVTAYGLAKSTTVTYNNTNNVSISAGTFYGYVKDAVGNANKCSIIIAKTTSKSTYTCRHEYDGCTIGGLYNGACYVNVNKVTISCTPNNCVNGVCQKKCTYGCTSGSIPYGSFCKSFVSYLNTCTSGIKTGGACYKYKQSSCASGWTKTGTNTTYSCASGYTKINNSWCKK